MVGFLIKILFWFIVLATLLLKFSVVENPATAPSLTIAQLDFLSKDESINSFFNE
jgi:hypothetical protein